MADLTFYTNPMSRGQIVRWMLEEVGQPYETVLLGYDGGMDAADYRAVNPMGKVPAIRHAGRVVTECAAICAYLADAFPDAGLAPPPADRAAYYRWLFFAAGPVEAAVTDRVLGADTAGKERMVGYGSYTRALDALETAIPADGAWIAGDAFSAADVYVGSQIDWGLNFRTVEERPGFVAYAERLRARPAYRRAKEIDGRLIAEQQAQQQQAG